MDPVVTINGERLWASLMDMAEIGKTPGGGSGRLALTEHDAEARKLLIRWAEEAGCTVSIDGLGNMFLRREGRHPVMAPIGFGSHLDTQPLGGRFDGVLGVLAGLEVMRSLNDADITTERPLVLVDWTNEEGSRFAPAMVSSGVYAGTFDKQWMFEQRDRHGVSQGEALKAIGFEGDAPIGQPGFERFFELHIEQGPVLENEGLDIGIVDSVQGISWYDLVLKGHPTHSGTTPMGLRRDALYAASRLISGLIDEVNAQDPEAMVTFGELDIESPSRNVIPGEIRLSLDLRHLGDDRLKALENRVMEHIDAVVSETGVVIEAQRSWHSPTLYFDSDNVAMVEEAAQRHGLSAKRMPSGAGHDSVHVAKVAPTSMIFIPSLDGVSHNEAEYSSPVQCQHGAQVLCDAILQASKA